MKTFTIFFCGTGSNSDDFHNPLYRQGELVSTLAKNHRGVEFDDWIIVDGPGSGNFQEDEKWVKSGVNLGVSRINYPNILGQLAGAGWEENVAHAIAVLKKKAAYIRTRHTNKEIEVLKPLFKENGMQLNAGRFLNPSRKITPQDLQETRAKIMKIPLPARVNLVGWSRGGVTCHMMANAMLEDPELRHIQVNIFAVDPVPGLGKFRTRRVSIGGNVNDYVAVYARDERSIGFAATIPAMGNRGSRKLHVFPGRHATLVGNQSGSGASSGHQIFSAPGKIIRHLAERFLYARGAVLNNMLALDDISQLRLYDEMIGHESNYIAMRTEVYTFPHGTERWMAEKSNWGRSNLSQVKQLSYQSPVFVNRHHYVMFTMARAEKRPDIMALLPNTARRIAAANRMAGVEG